MEIKEFESRLIPGIVGTSSSSLIEFISNHKTLIEGSFSLIYTIPSSDSVAEVSVDMLVVNQEALIGFCSFMELLAL